MGGDGGSIPHRRELVKTNRKKEEISKEDNLISKWQHCALSQQPLQAPVVACQLGRLFNKEALIHYLLDKSVGNSQFSYITSLKDVKELKLTMNCEYSNAFQKSGSNNINSEYICPITGIEMTGRFKFVYFFTCGCVLSERALREIKDHSCTKCTKLFNDDDVIIINGDDEDVAALIVKLENRKLRLKQKRKATSSNCQLLNKINKTKKLSDTLVNTSSSNNEQFDDNCTEMHKNSIDLEVLNNEDINTDPQDINNLDNIKKNDLGISDITDGYIDNYIINDCHSSIKADLKNDNGKMKVGQGALSSIRHRSKNSDYNITSKSEGLKIKKDKSNKTDNKQKNQEKIKSVQDDPNASAAYKSLFSTHETAKRQAKAHWVTYNPLFY